MNPLPGEGKLLVVSIVGSVAFLLSLVLTKLLINSADAIGMVDSPNQRSSHSKPTPKGGGLAFFLVFIVLSLGIYILNPEYKPIVFPLLFGAPVVVLLGWLDDRYTLSAKLRLGVHFLVATFIFALVTQWFQFELFASFLPEIFWINAVFCILFISWFINLYNFMDGADGLAASTAIAASVLMAVIAYFHDSPEISLIYCLIAYTVSGFLCFNWFPAKIFMGDTGSYFLGFVFAALALVCKVHANISFYSHIIIFGFFITDATYTLFMRALGGHNVFHAHKQFGFHKLMAKGWTDRKVSAFYTMVIVLWLFPLANLASIYDDYGVAIVAISYLPLLVFEVYNKAGQP